MYHKKHNIQYLHNYMHKAKSLLKKKTISYKKKTKEKGGKMKADLHRDE